MVVVVEVVDVVVFFVGEGVTTGLLEGRNVIRGTSVGLGLNSDQKVVMPGGRNVGGHLVAVTAGPVGPEMDVGLVTGRITFAGVGLGLGLEVVDDGRDGEGEDDDVGVR